MEKPSWSRGECAWAIAQGLEELQRWCTGWRAVCEPKACERKKWAAQERAKELRAYRDFPGNPLQVASKSKPLPRGHCRWCGDGIWSDKDPTKLNLRRTWHPDCLHRYYLHTRAEEQLPHLIERDGPGCRLCGKICGGWRRPTDYRTGEVAVYQPGSEAYWAKRVGPADGPFCAIWWSSSLQVDHVIALGVVVVTIPAPKRWRFWGPGNLQAICHACHVEKTKADVVSMKAARRALPAPDPAA